MHVLALSDARLLGGAGGCGEERRSKGGTGLGLNILYNIISNSLNGSIVCHSEENNGVEFVIEFI